MPVYDCMPSCPAISSLCLPGLSPLTILRSPISSTQKKLGPPVQCDHCTHFYALPYAYPFPGSHSIGGFKNHARDHAYLQTLPFSPSSPSHYLWQVTFSHTENVSLLYVKISRRFYFYLLLTEEETEPTPTPPPSLLPESYTFGIH